MPLSHTENTVRFGQFKLDLRTRQLTKNGAKIRLPQQPIQVLSLLLEDPGEIVTREEFRRRLWPSDVFVDFDHGLNKSIQKLRDALGDSAGSPSFVETIPRVGYRFIAEVNEVTRAVELEPEIKIPQSQDLFAPPPASAVGRSRRTRWPLLASGMALMALAGFWLIQRELLAPAAIRSVAVIPLENLSGDTSQEYFADGMTDELITMLAKDSSLRIVSRTSVMQYKRAHRPLSEIARALHVDAILEGSVSRSAHQVHMTLQLIRADTDSHVWADSYDRNADDVTLPDEAAQAIAKRLHSAVAPKSATPYVSPAAHDAYLRGRYLSFTDRMEESGAWFRKAIEIQPDYALAWAGLADYYGEGVSGDLLDPRTSLAPEEQAAERALQLDPNLAEAHKAMGLAFLVARWDPASADREALRAISLNPQDGDVYYLRACALQALNRNSESIEAGKRAMEVDPFARPYLLAAIYIGPRQYDAALADIQLRLEANPYNLDLLALKMDIWRRKGNYKQAVDTWARWHVLAGDPQSAVNLRRAWEQGGARAFVRWELGRRLAQSKAHYVSPVELASYYAQLGDKERTLALLEEGYRQRATDTLWIQQDPAYDFLHGDARYRAIVQNTGMPPAAWPIVTDWRQSGQTSHGGG